MVPKKPAPHSMRGEYRFPACAKPPGTVRRSARFSGGRSQVGKDHAPARTVDDSGIAGRGAGVLASVATAAARTEDGFEKNQYDGDDARPLLRWRGHLH